MVGCLVVWFYTYSFVRFQVSSRKLPKPGSGSIGETLSERLNVPAFGKFLFFCETCRARLTYGWGQRRSLERRRRIKLSFFRPTAENETYLMTSNVELALSTKLFHFKSFQIWDDLLFLWLWMAFEIFEARWWFQYFLIFTPILREDFQFDLRIFFRWVGEKPPTSPYSSRVYFPQLQLDFSLYNRHSRETEKGSLGRQSRTGNWGLTFWVCFLMFSFFCPFLYLLWMKGLLQHVA